jgi:hypothetical protein
MKINICCSFVRIVTINWQPSRVNMVCNSVNENVNSIAGIVLSCKLKLAEPSRGGKIKLSSTGGRKFNLTAHDADFIIMFICNELILK